VKLVDRDETILIVVGDTDANDPDRQVADTLCQEITGRGGGLPYRRAVLVGDGEFLDRPDLHRHPTVAIGGPGVNAVAQRLVSELPTVWQLEDRAFVQADTEESRRVALWGMDAAATARAVEAFRSEGYLNALLERIWRVRPGQMM
jgi:hypothetical protein